MQFDSSWFDHFQFHEPRRAYQLPRLGLAGADSEVCRGMLRYLLGLTVTNRPRVRCLGQKLAGMAGLHYINEANPAVCETTAALYSDLPAGPVYLNGYWQTFDHALAVRDELRRALVDGWSYSPGAEALRSEIGSSDAVFLHLRQGDYIRFGLPLLGDRYYSAACELIHSAVPDARFYIFSEEPEVARGLVRFPPGSRLVEYSSPHRDIEDLLLMAECRGGVVANSSYSWWGGMLSRHTAPIVLPPVWLRQNAPTPVNLIAPGWRVAEPAR